MAQTAAASSGRLSGCGSGAGFQVQGKNECGFHPDDAPLRKGGIRFRAGAMRRSTVLDPVCGRGTTLFLRAAGGESRRRRGDRSKDRPRSGYLFRSAICSITAASTNGKPFPPRCLTAASAQEIRYRLLRTRGDRQTEDRRTLRLFRGDTAQADRMAGRESCHLLVADLPYGVQHAPQGGKELSTPGS